MLTINLRHTAAILLPLLVTGSLATAHASAPAQLPCAVWSAHQSTVCMRAPIPSLPQTVTSNWAIDQAMGSLRKDILIVSKPTNTTSNIHVTVRNDKSAPITSKVKNAERTATAKPIVTATTKPKLSRSEIVKQELQREKAALRAAENQLNQAKKTGKNVSKWERHVADRRASISAMQAELARL